MTVSKLSLSCCTRLLCLVQCTPGPHSDAYWHSFLQANGRVNFTELPASLCGLVASVAKIGDAVVGLVVYEGDSQNSSKYFGGDGYSAAIALTLASQQRLLPVAAASLAR